MLIRYLAGMAAPGTNIVEYASPAVRVVAGWRTRVITGIIAGVAAYASAYVVGPIGIFPVALIAGLIVGWLSARAATTHLAWASISGNLIAVASLFTVSASVGLLNGNISLGQVEWSFIPFLVILMTAIFVVPGLLGCLLVWEGRKPAPSDADRPAK